MIAKYPCGSVGEGNGAEVFRSFVITYENDPPIEINVLPEQGRHFTNPKPCIVQKHDNLLLFRLQLLEQQVDLFDA